MHVCGWSCESDGCVSLRSSVTAVTDQGGVFLPCGNGGGGVFDAGRVLLESFITVPHSPIAERTV